MKIHTAVVSGILLAMLAGCSTEAAVDRNNDFGESVRQMVQQQTYNPNAEAQGTAIPKEGLMGDKAATAMKNYRTGKSISNTTDSVTSPALPSSSMSSP